MFTKSALAALALLATTSAFALAAATADEAAKIKGSLQSYLGAEPGVVSVAPEGDDYLITIDIVPYLKKGEASGLTASITPFKLKARPQGEGLWQVSSSGPMDMNFSVAGAISSTMRIAAFDWKGIFDESLGGLIEQNYSMNGMTLTQSMEDPQTKIKNDVAYGIESIVGGNKSTNLGNGIADAQGALSFTGITTATKNQFPPEMVAQGMPNLDYTATLAKGSYTSNSKGVRVKALMDLLAWLVAHPEKEMIVKDQAQLIAKISAALPLFDNISTSGKAENIALATSVGQFTLASLGSIVDVNGAVADGKLREGFNLSGITIPPGIAPPWATELVPSNFNMDFALSDFNLEAPARMILGQLDLSKEPPIPAGAEVLLLPAFVPKNAMKINFTAGEVSSALYALNYDGEVTANFAGLPTAKATFKMKGLDAVLAKIQAAAGTDPMAQQAVPVLIAAKGLGKAEADGSLIWVVEFDGANKITVNGLDVGNMGAGQ